MQVPDEPWRQQQLRRDILRPNANARQAGFSPGRSVSWWSDCGYEISFSSDSVRERVTQKL